MVKTSILYLTKTYQKAQGTQFVKKLCWSNSRVFFRGSFMEFAFDLYFFPFFTQDFLDWSITGFFVLNYIADWVSID
jgi:hypothetical protein